MLILHATAKLRVKIGGTPPEPDAVSTTALGGWYANYVRGARKP